MTGVLHCPQLHEGLTQAKNIWWLGNNQGARHRPAVLPTLSLAEQGPLCEKLAESQELETSIEDVLGLAEIQGCEPFTRRQHSRSHDTVRFASKQQSTECKTGFSSQADPSF